MEKKRIKKFRVKGGREIVQRERQTTKGVRRGRQGRVRRPCTISTDDMRATVIDHVVVHSLSTAEAGQRVCPNLSRFSVPTLIRTFREHNRYCSVCVHYRKYLQYNGVLFSSQYYCSTNRLWSISIVYVEHSFFRVHEKFSSVKYMFVSLQWKECYIEGCHIYTRTSSPHRYGSGKQHN